MTKTADELWSKAVIGWRYTADEVEPTAARLSAFIHLMLTDLDYFGGVRAISKVPVMVSPSSVESLVEFRMKNGQSFELVVRKKELNERSQSNERD